MSSHSSSYEHWPDSASLTSDPIHVEGFDTANGLRQYEYEPAVGDDKEAAPKPPAPAANEKKKRDEKTPKAQPAVQYLYQMPPQAHQPMMCYPQMPFVCFPQGAIPAPAYYGVPQQLQGYWCAPGYGMPPGHMSFPAPEDVKQEEKPQSESDEKKDDNKEEKKEKKVKKLEAMKWQGRTKTEVEEDDMIIAKKEGAYAKRKIVPIELDADQPVWVVMSDGKMRIRTFAEAQEMKGEWHEDPRFKGSLYLVCETEENKGDEEKDRKMNKRKGGTKGTKGTKDTKTDGEKKGEEVEGKKCSCQH